MSALSFESDENEFLQSEDERKILFLNVLVDQLIDQEPLRPDINYDLAKQLLGIKFFCMKRLSGGSDEEKDSARLNVVDIYSYQE